MSGFRFQLRPAHEGDCLILSQLHAACFPRGWGEAEFASFFERDGIVGLLAMAEQQPVGFIFCWVVAGESELLAVAVLPGHRGGGLGRALLAEALHRCTSLGAEAMHLEVGIGNEAAIKLYEAQGFEITGRRKGYYQQPGGVFEDALTMSKKLSFC